MSLPPATDHEELEALMGQVLDEYAERLARGEQPDVEEYACRYPQLAAVLRLTLPALEAMRTEEASKNGEGAALIAPEAEGRLGDYRILRAIGRGGMGIVYEAIQTSLDRRVALKVLPFAGALDAKQLQRFRNEAHAAAQLHHTNIVPVYAVGCERGVHYYAMQFIDGQTLAAVIAELRRNVQSTANVEGRMTNDERMSNDQVQSTHERTAAAAAQTKLRDSTLGIHSSFVIRHSSFFRTVAGLGIQAADALEHAHDQGVIHRDIKPANLLVDVKSNLWITDFGLAHCQSQPGLTLSGDLVGTLRYMSPEQALGKRGLIDHRTDIYSLGVTLYELLTLEPAFSSNNREELLRQIAYEEPRLPRRLNKPIPAELEIIVLKAMEKNPEDRYGSAKELAEDLEQFLQNKPIRARPARWWKRAWKWARRRPALTAVYLLLLATLALSAMGAGAARLWQRAEAERLDAVAARDQAQIALKQEQRALAREAQARHRLAVVSYLNKVQLAHHALKDGDLARAQLLLDQCPPELRHWEWYYVHHLCHGEVLTLQGHTAPVRSVVYCADGRRLVSSDGATVRVWDLAAGREILTIRAGEHAALIVSPDCSRFASNVPVGEEVDGRWAESEIKVGDLATGQESLTLQIPGTRFTSLVFSPDGQQLAASSNVHEPRPGGRTLRAALRVWDLGTRQVCRTFNIDGACFMSMVFSPDGKRLAASSYVRKIPQTSILPHEVKVWDLATGREILTFKGITVGGEYAFSPDGKRLASPSSDKEVKVWDLSAQHGPLTFKGHSQASRVMFSPKGNRMAGFSHDGSFELWDVATGKSVGTAKGPAGGFSGAAFSPDGKRLAGWGSADKAIRVWDLKTGREILTFQGHTERVDCVAFHPDGRRLASGSRDKTIKLWDIATAPQQQTLMVANDVFGALGVAYSPDGRRLATAGRDKKLKVWDTATGHELFHLQGDAKGYWSVAFSPDGRHLASSTFDESQVGTVKVWDLTTRRETVTLRGHTSFVMGFAYSPDGSRLATAGWEDRTVKMWEAATGRELYTLGGFTKAVYSLAFSPDGRRLATASDENAVKVWDLAAGQVAFTLQGHTNGERGVAFSPDGRFLATAAMDSTVRLWDLTTGKELWVVHSQGSGGNHVVFSPDGQRLANGSQGGMVKILEVLTGEEALTLQTSAVTSLAFSPDGRQLAAALCDGTAKLWTAPSFPGERKRGHRY